MWFFGDKAWKNVNPKDVLPDWALDAEEEKLRLELPCVLHSLDSEAEKRKNDIANAKAEVEAGMKQLGFDLRLRPPINALRENYPLIKLEPESGPRIVVNVYTDPGVSQATCSRQSDFTRALCCYRGEALARGGTAIGLDRHNDTPDTALKKILHKSHRMRIGELHVFGHGEKGGQQLGKDLLTSTTPIPPQLASRLAAGGTIFLYGCNVGADGTLTTNDAEKLAMHIGNTMLLRGGNVIMFRKKVDLDAIKWRVMIPSHDKWVRKSYGPCDGIARLLAILLYMRRRADTWTVAEGKGK